MSWLPLSEMWCQAKEVICFLVYVTDRLEVHKWSHLHKMGPFNSGTKSDNLDESLGHEGVKRPGTAGRGAGGQIRPLLSSAQLGANMLPQHEPAVRKNTRTPLAACTRAKQNVASSHSLDAIADKRGTEGLITLYVEQLRAHSRLSYLRPFPAGCPECPRTAEGVRKTDKHTRWRERERESGQNFWDSCSGGSDERCSGRDECVTRWQIFGGGEKQKLFIEFPSNVGEQQRAVCRRRLFSQGVFPCLDKNAIRLGG